MEGQIVYSDTVVKFSIYLSHSSQSILYLEIKLINSEHLFNQSEQSSFTQ